MEKLLQPDFGLMFWTCLVFVLTVLVLGKTTWKPIIAAIEEREARLKAEREASEAARASAERLKAELDKQLAEIQAKANEALQNAIAAGNKTRDEILKAAQDEAKSIADKTRKQLEEEKDRLVRELRKEVADLSMKAAERLIGKSVDENVQKKVLDEFFVELQSKKASKN